MCPANAPGASFDGLGQWWLWRNGKTFQWRVPQERLSIVPARVPSRPAGPRLVPAAPARRREGWEEPKVYSQPDSDEIQSPEKDRDFEREQESQYVDLLPATMKKGDEDYLEGLGQGLLDVFFGKSQAWYTNVSKIQDGLTLEMNEVATIGQPLWDQFVQAARSSQWTLPLGVSDWYSFEFITGAILHQVNSILVSSKRIPSDADVNFAAARMAEYRVLIDWVKPQIPPDAGAAVQAESDALKAKLEGRGPMLAPSDAGQKAFLDSVERRAGDLAVGAGMLGLRALFKGPMLYVTGLALAAAAFATWKWLTSGRRAA